MYNVLLPINKKHLKASVDKTRDKRTVISPYSLDTLTVHLVVFYRVCPEQTSVALFVDQ